MDRDSRFDFVVVGGGIAGTSLAAALSEQASVLLLERESQPGYHSTGRSAALFVEAYGPPLFRALTRASGAFFKGPPNGFVQHPLLTPRGFLAISLAGEETAMGDLLANDPSLRELTIAEAKEHVPILNGQEILTAAYSDETFDIDTASLLSGYGRLARHNGCQIAGNAEVLSLARDGKDWAIETREGSYSAPVVVNAAGAWADTVAKMAGIAPLGLTPKRRTGIIVAAPDGIDPSHWPVVENASETLYFKPDAGNIMVSPADATPCPPCDVQPEELDIAIAVDRFETMTGQSVRRVEHSWAGLRTFASDSGPVVGYDSGAEGFFWLAGQGGYGIQSAPAMARTAFALCLGRDIPEDVLHEGVSAAAIAPDRLKSASPG